MKLIQVPILENQSQSGRLQKKRTQPKSALMSPKSNQNSKREKLKVLANTIHIQNLHRIESLSKKYLTDYTEFQYRIDSTLNQAYKYVKKLEWVKDYSLFH